MITQKNHLPQRLTVIFAAILFIGIASASFATDRILLSKGQTVYVPVYSNVIAGPREVPVRLSNTLIIRNTDIHNDIMVLEANYYDTKGVLIKRFYPQPVTLAPLETKYLYLPTGRKQKGGVGANFIIRWRAAKEVNAPIIECVMVGSQGRSFLSPSRAVEEDTK